MIYADFPIITKCREKENKINDAKILNIGKSG